MTSWQIVDWAIIATISQINLRNLQSFIINTKTASLSEPSWPFPTSRWCSSLDPLKWVMCSFLKYFRGRAENLGAPHTHPCHSPFEWDVQICFSLEQPLVHMVCSWRRCACVSGNLLGAGLAPEYGLLHQNQDSGDAGLQVTNQQQGKSGYPLCMQENKMDLGIFWLIPCYYVEMWRPERERFEVFHVCYINLAGKSKASVYIPLSIGGPATIQFSLDNITLIFFWKITSSPLALGLGTIFFFQTLYLTLVWDWKYSVILSLVHFTNIHWASTLFQTLVLVLKTWKINSQCLLTSDFVEFTGQGIIQLPLT